MVELGFLVLAFWVGVCEDGLRESFLFKDSGWRPLVFGTVGPQGSLFELLLPPGMRVLSGELAEIDVLLDDPRFFRPFRGFFDPCEGRPSIPMETYLRLLFLKCRYRLGYEQLCVQVNDSLSWRRFCRIGLEAWVLDEFTIRKLTRRLGPGVVDELNVLLLGLAAMTVIFAWNGFGSTRPLLRPTSSTRPIPVCSPKRSVESPC